MIYNATKLIDAEMKKAELKHSVRETESLSYVELGFTGKNGSFTLRFISGDDDNDVKALTGDFATYPEGKREDGYRVLNSLNKKYKYTKFVLDPEDGGVCAHFDFPLKTSTADVGPIAVEIALRFSRIIDDVYPEIMKSIWS